LDKRGSLLVVRGWFDSEGWFRPSGDFGNPPPLWVRRLLFWDQQPRRKSLDKIHRSGDSRFLSPFLEWERLVWPEREASRGEWAYKPGARGKTGLEDTAGEASKERIEHKSWFSPEQAEKSEPPCRSTLSSLRPSPSVIQLSHFYYTPSEMEKENVSVKKNLRVFSQSSGLKGTRKYSIAQAQGVRSARGRTASAGKHPHSGAVAWIPQGTCPRPP
jgi:hypothetical protein